MRLAGLLLSLVFLTACNSYNLRYQANPQPPGANLFADYTPLQDSVGFSIDTDGRRLQEVFIKKTDGAVVRPINIVYPGYGRSSAVGSGIGFGGGHVGFGTGLLIPVGPERTNGMTTATFAAPAIGEAPWELHVKVNGLPEAVIPGVGGAATAK